MKKGIIITIAVLLIVSVIGFAGCSLLGGTTDSLASGNGKTTENGSSGTSSVSGGGTTVAELQAEIAKYQAKIAELTAADEALDGRVDSLEEDFQKMIDDTNSATYTDATKEELEAALAKYQGIVEVLADRTESLNAAMEQYSKIIDAYGDRVEELEKLLQQTISEKGDDIGAYANVYVYSVLNLTCTETKKSGVSGCQGTGFIISSDGYVLTNNHVISYEVNEINYDDYRGRNVWGERMYGTKTVGYEYSSIVAAFDEAATTYAGKTYTLEFIYRDPSYDLALCKIKEAAPAGTTWKAIPFYDGSVTRGDELLVLGNARGFGLSATAGLVSATGKKFTDSDYPDLTFIQTDAAINGGNSGGPAINIYGGLVGVVNSKFVSIIRNSFYTSEIEDVEGMGFAIELDKVKEFLAAASTAKSIEVKYETVTAPTAVQAS